MKVFAALFGALFFVAFAVLSVFLFGMRTKSPAALKPIRRMNRRYFNPRQRDPGTPGAYASLIGHTGRRTGASYKTPVVAEATEDGFVIALPYGSQADWLKNVLASGSATIVHEGSAHSVIEPEIVPIETVDAYFSPGARRSHRIFGTRECLRVRRAGVSEPTEHVATGSVQR